MQFVFPTYQLPFWGGAVVLFVGVIFGALHYLERRQKVRLHRFVELRLAGQLLAAYHLRSRRPLLWLPLVGSLFLALAFAQPHWGRTWMPVTRSSRDILVLLDISLSMNAENPAPSRLVRAKQKVESLLDACPADRFGLVGFAGESVSLCPLTLDHGYLRSILNAIHTDTLSVGGTDLESALQEAVKLFEEDTRRFGDAGRQSRAVVLITDGEQTSGDALKFASQIREYAHIYVLGIGDPKGAVVEFPAWMRRYVRMPENELTRLSILDEENLSRLATESGGAYVRITPDNADIRFVHQELESLSGRLASDTIRYRLVNRYRWPLVVAFLCFAMEGAWLTLLPWIRRYRLHRYGDVMHA